MMGNFEFHNPWFLILLLFIPVMVYFRFRKKTVQAAVKISTIEAFKGLGNWMSVIKPCLFLLRMIGISLMIIALARPQIVQMTSTVKSDKGIDILMVVDTSLSMLAKDLKPDRLEALKEVAEKFSLARLSDRIGLVAYSGEAIAKVPLTTDHRILVNEIRSLKTGELEDGTAIGVGLATATNHLKDSKATSKVIILITDGVESVDYQNDLFYVSPQVATQIAKANDIKVYTIGVGTNGMAPFPTNRDIFSGELIFSMQPVEIDEVLLKSIAQQTGGQYFRATDNESLKEIYGQIDKLEKSEINEVKYYNYTELFTQYLKWGLCLLLVELILSRTLLKELT